MKLSLSWLSYSKSQFLLFQSNCADLKLCDLHIYQNLVNNHELNLSTMARISTQKGSETGDIANGQIRNLKKIEEHC